MAIGAKSQTFPVVYDWKHKWMNRGGPHVQGSEEPEEGGVGSSAPPPRSPAVWRVLSWPSEGCVDSSKAGADVKPWPCRGLVKGHSHRPGLAWGTKRCRNPGELANQASLVAQGWKRHSLYFSQHSKAELSKAGPQMLILCGRKSWGENEEGGELCNWKHVRIQTE